MFQRLPMDNLMVGSTSFSEFCFQTEWTLKFSQNAKRDEWRGGQTFPQLLSNFEDWRFTLFVLSCRFQFRSLGWSYCPGRVEVASGSCQHLHSLCLLNKYIFCLQGSSGVLQLSLIDVPYNVMCNFFPVSYFAPIPTLLYRPAGGLMHKFCAVFIE